MIAPVAVFCGREHILADKLGRKKTSVQWMFKPCTTSQRFPWRDGHMQTSLLRNRMIVFRLLAAWCLPSCIREVNTFYIFTVWLKKKWNKTKPISPNSLKPFQILFQRVTKPNGKAMSSKCSVNNNIKCNSQMLVVWIISSSRMASCWHERDNYEMQTLWLGNTLQSNGRFSVQHREAYQLCYYLPNIYAISYNFRQDFTTHESIFMDSIAETLLNTFPLH